MVWIVQGSIVSQNLFSTFLTGPPRYSRSYIWTLFPGVGDMGSIYIGTMLHVHLPLFPFFWWHNHLTIWLSKDTGQFFLMSQFKIFLSHQFHGFGFNIPLCMNHAISPSCFSLRNPQLINKKYQKAVQLHSPLASHFDLLWKNLLNSHSQYPHFSFKLLFQVVNIRLLFL